MLGDRCVGLAGQVPPIHALRSDRCQYVQLHIQVSCRRDTAHRFPEGHVAEIGRRSAGRAVRIDVTQGDRYDALCGIGRALQHCAAKRQDCGTIGRRTFGKDGNRIAGYQGRDDRSIQLRRRTSAAPFEKQCLVRGDQPADQRPLAYLGLADESCRAQGRKDEDIEPRNMIGDNHAPARRKGTRGPQSDIDDAQQPARPPGADCAATLATA